MTISVYNETGTDTGTFELPKTIFGLPWNADLVRQAVEAYRANARVAVAHAKDRGEVRGGGKKPWRQKGTGRARHGSIRSPLWSGGGVTHGPTREKVFAQKLGKNMARKALLVSLSAKARDKEIVVVDAAWAKSKTNAMHGMFLSLRKGTGIEALGAKGGRAIVALAEHNAPAARAMRNLAFVAPREARNLNALDVLSYKYIILPREAIGVLEKTFVKR